LHDVDTTSRREGPLRVNHFKLADALAGQRPSPLASAKHRASVCSAISKISNSGLVVWMPALEPDAIIGPSQFVQEVR
jgi:hypothetical protein